MTERWILEIEDFEELLDVINNIETHSWSRDIDDNGFPEETGLVTFFDVKSQVAMWVQRTQERCKE